MTRQLSVEAPAGLPFIEFERDFDAPAAAVFRAHQDPELIRQWIGPDGYEAVVEHYDFRTGGSYRYIHKTDHGDFAFHGVFHVVRDNEFAIQTFEFEGLPDVVSIETISFEDLPDGRSRIRGHATYPTLEARDGMVSSGMESGMSEGYRRLDTLLASELAPAGGGR